MPFATPRASILVAAPPQLQEDLLGKAGIALGDDGGVGVDGARDDHEPFDSQRGQLRQAPDHLVGGTDEREAVDELVLEPARVRGIGVAVAIVVVVGAG